MIKIISLVSGMLIALALSNVQAQEAQIDEITISSNVKKKVYHNEAFHLNEDASPVRITNVSVSHIPPETDLFAEAYRKRRTAASGISTKTTFKQRTPTCWEKLRRNRSLVWKTFNDPGESCVRETQRVER